MSENLNVNNDLTPMDRQTVAVFNHPDDVLGDASLTREEKKALLASWASDACSVENAPAVRQIGSGAIVSLADILAALNALDAHQNEAARRTRRPVGSGRRPILLHARRRLVQAFHRHDDDDDPPPSPTAARPWVPVPMLNARAA